MNCIGLTVALLSLHLIATYEANCLSFPTTENDNNSTQILTTFQPSIASSERILFNYYIDGLYGNDCITRIVNFISANNLELSNNDLYCACYGYCAPPLAPNPGADAWAQAQIQSLNSVTSVVTYFQTYAVFIVITGLVVILGLAGKNTTVD